MFGFCGSISRSVAPVASVVSRSRLNVWPPSVDSQIPKRECVATLTRRSPLRPRRTATYRWFTFVGSTTTREIDTPTK